jgi:hypothetical protein
MMLEGELTRKR